MVRLECVYLMNIALYINSPHTAKIFHLVNKTCYLALHSLRTNPTFFQGSPTYPLLQSPQIGAVCRLIENIETLEMDLYSFRVVEPEVFNKPYYKITISGLLEDVDYKNLQRIESRVIWYRGPSSAVSVKMTSLRTLHLTDTTQLRRVLSLLPFLRYARTITMTCGENDAEREVIALVENLCKNVLVKIRNVRKDVLGKVPVCGIGVVGSGKGVINLPDFDKTYHYSLKALKPTALKRLYQRYLPLQIAFEASEKEQEIEKEIDSDLSQMTTLKSLQLKSVNGTLHVPSSLECITVRSSNVILDGLQECYLSRLVLEKSITPFPFNLKLTIKELRINDIHLTTISNFSDLQLVNLALINCKSQNVISLPSTLRTLELENCTFPVNINDEVLSLSLDTYTASSHFTFPRALTRLEIGNSDAVPETQRCNVMDLKLFECENFKMQSVPLSVKYFGLFDSINSPKKIDMSDHFFANVTLSLCPKIQNLIPPYCVTELHIESCHALTFIDFKVAGQLELLFLNDLRELKRVEGIPKTLRFIKINRCHSLTEIVGIDTLKELPVFMKEECGRVVQSNLDKDGQSFSSSTSEM
ncbi:hypothetical protein EIN_097550 [Entamoeba invadens IP1]|uniref:Leucine-rich repeat containing protein n=1 Tax=Entamoeba invadens IP1 TaxID=370355 RepID=A0A0A1U439_ENTIV|nr:hypothetical protein EIN_097550 [Entamoeba invadens IP1]ELP87468.1 hypothetical protein EIN_097550 [Entamoeba invadens IP1]|eukprot:XP_004254239.1 hypothetical protein EIN_097550 [Entamoeba invadens IP1]